MRVRFAPSPTGALHIGGARTALYNWLLARHAGGTLVLRIEDTDRERSTPENVEQILDALRWLELDWDEGPISQVSRTDRHEEVLQRLLDEGHAYRSNATGDDVKACKAEHGADRGFRGEAEAEGAVRLRVPDEGETVVHDLIRGDTTFRHVHLDDPVIARADGTVLYNFAVAIDDLDADITHVIRGEDHLSNTPKQLLVYEALGAEPPLFAHLPLLHGPDGKKLSKRHGAASVQELRAAGYLPEAVRNYLALLGWGDTDDETILSTDELVAPLPDRARLAQSGALRRAEAALDERPLRPRRSASTSSRERLEGYLGRDGDLRPAVAISRGEDADAGGLLAAGRVHLRRPRRRSQGAREVARRGRPGGAPGRTRRARRRRAVHGRRASNRRSARWSRARGAKPRDVFQPIRVALAGTTVSRASSRRSRCSAATRRCGASTRRSQPERVRPTQQSGSRLNQTSIPADNRGVTASGPLLTASMPTPASVTPITTQNPDAAGVQRRHNEGHGRRLTAAFEALEAFPALAESRDRLLRLVTAERISPGDVVAAVESDVALVIAVLRLANQVEGKSRGKRRVGRRGRRAPLARGGPDASRSAPAPSTSSSARPSGTPRPSASACTASPPSAPPTASRPRPATSTATASWSRRCCTTSASSS